MSVTFTQGLAVAAGQPVLNGTYIPEAWAGKLLVKFYAATVFGQIANTDYQGEIKGQGDRVEIRTCPDVQINDYSLGQALTIQRPTPTVVELQINKAKYWNFLAEDVQVMQSDLAYVEKWTEDAAEQLKIAIDRDVLANVYLSADTTNSGATAGAQSGSINLGQTGAPVTWRASSGIGSNPLDMILRCNTCMDENNLPENDRYVVLPPWAINQLKRTDLEQVQITGDGTSPIRSGLVGKVDRTMIYSSNNLANVTDTSVKCWHSVFGQKTGLTFASQLVKSESLKAESTFGTIFRGLQVYGYSVVKSAAFGHLYITQ